MAMVKIIDKIHERRRKFKLQQHRIRQLPPTEESTLSDTTDHRSNKTGQYDDCEDQKTMTTTTTTSIPYPGWYYSFEFFPPKTEAGLDNLMTRIDRMTQRLDPLFIDITWSRSSAATSMALASHAQRYLGVDVLLHLTVQGMSRGDLIRCLEQCRASGVHNILVLRGDPPQGQRKWRVGQVVSDNDDNNFEGKQGDDTSLPRAIDLVKLIRERYGDEFGIAVAGHPEGHPSSVSPEEEMQHLKDKINAGADFVITQFFYRTDLFLDFVLRCRAAGIDCPILPGILPIQSYSNFRRMTDYGEVAVPPELWQRLEPFKDNDEAVKEIGYQVASHMCREILTKADGVDGVHFYTLNLERSVTQVLMDLGAIDVVLRPNKTTDKSVDLDDNKDVSRGQSKALTPLLTDTVTTKAGRQLPWRPSAQSKRSQKEQVRPINWANRPKSYVRRTEDWDEFPNGRWGDSTSPAFGELSDFTHFYSFSLGTDDDRRSMLGQQPKTANDIYDVFARYVEGEIPHLPWCETPLQPESYLIQQQLAALNRLGFMTINSQPAVNGAKSTDPSFGWGGAGGYVYQKAYCECFCSPDHAQRLEEMVKGRDGMNICCVNNFGHQFQAGNEPVGVTALTWGVFPNREIVQPTIFDPSAFLVWAEEAFSLWTTMWLNLYDFGSESYELIETIRDTYYLCAIIDNDFVAASDHRSEGSSIWEAMLLLNK